MIRQKPTQPRRIAIVQLQGLRGNTPGTISYVPPVDPPTPAPPAPSPWPRIYTLLTAASSVLTALATAKYLFTNTRKYLK